MKIVTWKDEGATGPAWLYPSAEAFAVVQRGLPYGVQRPGRQLGWTTRAKAQKLAALHAALFKEV